MEILVWTPPKSSPKNACAWVDLFVPKTHNLSGLGLLRQTFTNYIYLTLTFIII